MEKINKKLIEKLNDLNLYLKNNLDLDLFKNQQLKEIINNLVFFFQPFYYTQDYKQVLKDGLLLNFIYIDDDTFNLHYPIIQNKINNILSLLQKNNNLN